MRKSAILHGALTVLTCVMVFAFASAGLAQEPKAKTKERDPGRDLIEEAYKLTQKGPRTAEDYSEIIETIEAGLKQVKTESFAKYGKTLAAWAHFKRGELSTRGDSPDDAKALADFDAAVKLQDEADTEKPNWNYIHQRGVSYAVAGEYKKALDDFNRVIKLRPDFGKEYFNRAEIHWALGDYREAIRDYNRATRNGYNESIVFTRRGFAFFKLGDVRTALSQYGQAIERNNRDYEAYTYRGDARAASGDHGNALSDYQRAIAINPNYARANYSAAWFRATCPLSRYHNAQSALRLARKAIELEGETPRNLDCLAAAHARAGEFKEAVAVQEKAIAAAEQDAKDQLDDYQQRLKAYQDGKAWESLAEDGRKKKATGGSGSP